MRALRNALIECYGEVGAVATVAPETEAEFQAYLQRAAERVDDPMQFNTRRLLPKPKSKAEPSP